MSGCMVNNKATNKVVKKESKYFKYRLVFFWLLKIELIKIIKNGFTNSTGWNLGKKYISIHLFDPLISTPKIGTNTNKINEIRKRI